MKAFNVIDAQDTPTEFGARLFNGENGYDPFLEDDASLWLLHYQLVKSRIASTYSIIYNDFRREKILFSRETYVNYLKRRRESDPSLTFNENTVSDDFGVFVKMYQYSESGKDIEDSFSGILSELELLKTIGKGREEQFQIENAERHQLPAHIVLYAILDNDSYGNSISLNTLEYERNSPGSIFALNRIGLTNKIIDIVTEYKDVTYTDHAGIKELQFKIKPSAFSILDTYYGK
jgi:hypothetical protein